MSLDCSKYLKSHGVGSNLEIAHYTALVLKTIGTKKLIGLKFYFKPKKY